MVQYFTLPGYANSSKEHLQTYFENNLPNCRRINQQSWDKPICNDWVDSIEKTLLPFKSSKIVLITHSLGGIALVHWANRFNKIIKAAMIVAPPDLENPYKDLSLQSFLPIPLNKLKFPSLVVASSNDPWATIERSRLFANSWGSDFQNIGNAGHINPASGITNWSAGLEILNNFIK